MPQRASGLATGFAARALLPPVRPASSALIARAVSSRSCMSHALTRGSCKPTTAKVGPISQQLVASTSRRLLSSTNGGNSGGGGGGVAGHVTLVAQALSWATSQAPWLVVAAATVVMYGFYRGSMYVMHFFFNVSDKQIFEIGFAVSSPRSPSPARGVRQPIPLREHQPVPRCARTCARTAPSTRSSASSGAPRASAATKSSRSPTPSKVRSVGRAQATWKHPQGEYR